LGKAPEAPPAPVPVLGALGGARGPSGLRRPGGTQGLKQGSIAAMFARIPKKADLGPNKTS
jgi:hypothetical protein